MDGIQFYFIFSCKIEYHRVHILIFPKIGFCNP